MFDRLEIEGWRQFRNIDVRFHPRLTVLTGANGAGKTTMLNLLSQHFGWSSHFVSIPSLNRKDARRYLSGIDERVESRGPRHLIGKLTYGGGHQAALSIPVEVQAQYDVSIDGRQEIPGIYLPSHRPRC